MDTRSRYYFEKCEGELIKDDQIPDDCELQEVDGKKGRFRCCHGLIDREQFDSLELVELFKEKLFPLSFSYTPSGEQIPEWVQEECRCEISNFSESLLSDESNMSRNKFIIVVKFGVFMITRYNDDESKIDDEIEVMVVRFGALTTTVINGGDDYGIGSEIEEDIDDDEQIGFTPASKAAIEGLEKVSSLGGRELCAICLGIEEEDEEKEAKRMPCRHVYHAVCIDQWLEKSHFCPLCRQAMPL